MILRFLYYFRELCVPGKWSLYISLTSWAWNKCKSRPQMYPIGKSMGSLSSPGMKHLSGCQYWLIIETHLFHCGEICLNPGGRSLIQIFSLKPVLPSSCLSKSETSQPHKDTIETCRDSGTISSSVCSPLETNKKVRELSNPNLLWSSFVALTSILVLKCLVWMGMWKDFLHQIPFPGTAKFFVVCHVCLNMEHYIFCLPVVWSHLWFDRCT